MVRLLEVIMMSKVKPDYNSRWVSTAGGIQSVSLADVRHAMWHTHRFIGIVMGLGDIVLIYL